jgi:hypothetical protein
MVTLLPHLLRASRECLLQSQTLTCFAFVGLVLSWMVASTSLDYFLARHWDPPTLGSQFSAMENFQSS